VRTQTRHRRFPADVSASTRPSGRKADELRRVLLTRGYTRHAEGSVLVEFGDTRVICTVSVDERVPNFLKGTGKGWVTAEYGMLPRSTSERMAREAARGRQAGRTMEIQRLIGRALRAAVRLQTGCRRRSARCSCRARWLPLVTVPRPSRLSLVPPLVPLRRSVSASAVL